MEAKLLGLRTLVFSYLSIAVLCCSTSDQHRMPADLQKYITEIQKRGMSEQAYASLYEVAAIRTGAETLTYQKDAVSGEYAASYRSTTCPNPKLSHEESQRLQEKAEKAIKAEIEELRAFADVDGSKFISTEEAENFRFLVEFGYKVSFVSKQKGSSLQALAKALRTTEEDVRSRARQYHALAERMGVDSRALPTIPL